MTAEVRPLRVAVIDDDTIVRMGLVTHLPEHRVVRAYVDHEQLLAEGLELDVVLLDLNLRGGAGPAVRHGAAAVADLAQAGHRVLIYTNEQRRLVLARCLAAGARGIVHKTESLEALSAAIAAVHAGRVVITLALTGLAELIERQGELPELTPRQRQVLAGRARGDSFRRIARRLDISETTAHEHWGEVARKFAEYLRLHSPADLERHLGIGPDDLLAGP